MPGASITTAGYSTTDQGRTITLLTDDPRAIARVLVAELEPTVLEELLDLLVGVAA